MMTRQSHQIHWFSKRLKSVALLLSVLVLLLSIPPSTLAENAPAIELTQEERAWIKAHSAITLSITDDIPPRSFIDKDGKIKGTTVEYVRLFEQKLGLKINLVGSNCRRH